MLPFSPPGVGVEWAQAESPAGSLGQNDRFLSSAPGTRPILPHLRTFAGDVLSTWSIPLTSPSCFTA